MPNRLYFDTETTGLWNYREEKHSDKQPKLAQIGALLEDVDGRLLGEIDLMIFPEGWDIPKSASDIHKVTTEVAIAGGVTLANACHVFRDLIASAEIVVGHNVEFDQNIMDHALHMAGIPPIPWDKLKVECTKLGSMNIVKATPFKNGQWKWPSLDEAHRHFFDGRGVGEGAHNAMVDVKACQRIHHELLRMKVF